MNSHELILTIVGAIALFVSLFLIYLPAESRRHEIQVGLEQTGREIEFARSSLPSGAPSPRSLEELKGELGDYWGPLSEDISLTSTTEEIVSRSRSIEGIAIDSIIELGVLEPAGKEREEVGTERYLIRIVLKSSFADLSRFLHSLGRAGKPISVEEFYITNPGNRSELSRIDLILGVCKYTPAE